jgi:hypothetical protein
VTEQEAILDPHETLIALGEVAAAFAGFSGVVAAFGHRTPTEWSEAARFRFENLLTVSVAASILAFLPVVLTQFSISAARAWAGSSAALGLFCGTFLLQTYGRGRRINKRQLKRWRAIIWMSGMAGVAIAQLANLLVSGESRGGAPYVAGILVLLAISGLQFIFLALSSVSDDA